MRTGLIVSAVMAMVEGLALPVAGVPVRTIRKPRPVEQDCKAIEAAKAKRARKAAARARHIKD